MMGGQGLLPQQQSPMAEVVKSVSLSADTYLAPAVQQTAVLVAEQMVRDTAMRAAAAEHRATAEAQLEELKEQAISIMEHVQRSAFARVSACR